MTDRRITYLSGTRADFGLMRRTLTALAAKPSIAVDVVVSGMHTDAQFGDTAQEIVTAGLHIASTIPVRLSPATGATMARGIATVIQGVTSALERQRPDLMLLLGDRGEMLAGAIAAAHLGVPVAHIHGGERSGTIDEPVRHAISKLAHIHLTATEEARERLIRMGEDPAHIHVVGAPGLDFTGVDLGTVASDPGNGPILLIFHPVVQEQDAAAEQMRTVLRALEGHDREVIALTPNADAGSDAIRAALETWSEAAPRRQLLTHIPRDAFLGLMRDAAVMVGNSSAGIIEAASFGTPVVNVGSRQALRERNANVTDVPVEVDAIDAAIRTALSGGRFACRNIYGDGTASQKIADLLAEYPLFPTLLNKVNQY